MSIVIRDILSLTPQSGENNSNGAFTRTSVYIEGGKITGLGAAPEGFRPDREIDGEGRLLIPGLINSHTHSYMTILRNAADDLTFHDWLFGRISPLEDRMTPEDCYWGTQLGLMEMFSTGTTSFLDMYIFPHAAAKAVCDASGRAVLSRGLTGGENDPDGGERRIREALEEMDLWRERDNLSFMLAPHAPYTCDPGYQREVARTAADRDVGIHTHIAESRREVREIQEKYGKSPVALMEETGLLGPRTVAAHCVHLTDEDIDLLARRGVHVAHNPVSNLKLANGIAPVPGLLAAGVNVCLGTDGSASNNTLNLFGDLRLATLLHKGVSGDPQLVTAAEGVRLATECGAAALGLGDQVGKIQVGYWADLTILDLGHPNLQPGNNHLAALAYSASGHEVETTIVGGRIVYDRGEFPTIDRDRVLCEVERTCKRIGMRG